MVTTLETKNNPPTFEQLVSQFSDVIAVLTQDANLNQITTALSPISDENLESNHFHTWRGLARLIKKQDMFASRLSGTSHIEYAPKMLSLILKAYSRDQKQGIRLIDVILDNSTLRYLKLNQLFDWPDVPDAKDGDYQGEFTFTDWESLIQELSEPNNIFTRDEEMNALQLNPKSAARHRIPAVWSGRAKITEQEKYSGNFQACIELYRSQAQQKHD